MKNNSKLTVTVIVTKISEITVTLTVTKNVITLTNRNHRQRISAALL